MTQRINHLIRTGITKLTASRVEEWEGIVGNGAGTVYVPGTNNDLMYVRPVGSNVLVKVRTGSAPQTEGTHVWIGADYGKRRTMRALGTTAISPGITSVLAHAPTHFLNGTDPAWIDVGQIVNLLATPSGMTVTVKAGWVIAAGQAVWCEKQTLTFTAPGTGALYSLIRANSAGVLSSQDGTPVAAFVDLLKTDIPAVATGYAALWAVRLYAGQTAISWTTTASDLVDLRFSPQSRLAPINLDDLADVTITSATDNDVLSYQSGLWVNQPPAGALELIGEQIANGSSGTLSFTSIPGTYKSLKIVIVGRSDRAASVTDGLFVQMNGDTTPTNYRYSGMFIYTSSHYNIEGDNSLIGNLSAANSPANSPGSGSFEIPDYAGTVWNKIMIGLSSCRADNTSTHLQQIHSTVEWENNAAITRLDFVLSVGKFVSGSAIRLYGLN